MNTCKQIIVQYVESKQTFSIDELFAYISGKYKWTRATLNSAITKLVSENVLVKVSKGLYSASSNKNTFKIVPSENEKQLYTLLSTKYPFATFCIYNGSVLSPLHHHLSENNITYVETNKEAVESVFDTLKENNYTAYICPDSDFIYRYVDLSKNEIIVKPLVTEAPLVEVDGVKVPTLEKILVDIQKDADFSYLQGTETEYMIENAKNLFHINTCKLVRYGKRRGLQIKI